MRQISGFLKFKVWKNSVLLIQIQCLMALIILMINIFLKGFFYNLLSICIELKLMKAAI